MSEMVNKLSILLADTYALYLKTQNYHWHVRGPQFKALHVLFDDQYHALADAVDEIAERLLILGYKAPATFKDYERLKTIKDGDSNAEADQMLMELANDHGTLVSDLNEAMRYAEQTRDAGTVDLLSTRLSEHEKARWMLKASRAI